MYHNCLAIVTVQSQRIVWEVKTYILLKCSWRHCYKILASTRYAPVWYTSMACDVLLMQYWSLCISSLMSTILREQLQSEGLYKKCDFEQCSVFRQQGMYGCLHKKTHEHKHFNKHSQFRFQILNKFLILYSYKNIWNI